jgi:competence protein ComFC
MVNNMHRCLWCGNHFVIRGWRLVVQVKYERLCEKCQKKLVVTSATSCHKCHKLLQGGKRICMDCEKWEEISVWNGVLEYNKSLFYYNGFLKEIIATFKYRGDYEIIKALSTRLQHMYHKYFSSLPTVPIPLSEKRLYARGFNQAEAIANQIIAPKYHVLNRVASDQKQSKKTRRERLSFREPMFNCESLPEKLKGESVLLIDDLYTTGATIRHAAKALKDNGVSHVYSLTLARGIAEK